MTRPIVVATDTAAPDTDLERRMAAEEDAEYRCWDGRRNLLELLEDANVVFTNFVRFGEKELARLADGAVVIRYGIGVDNVDLHAAAEVGVRVCNVPDYGANVVADHTVMLALMLVRRVREFDAAMGRGEDPAPRAFGPVPSMESLTVGLVGAGRIAQLAAERLQALGCTTVAYDPHMDPLLLVGKGIELRAWDDLLAGVDIISLHLPLSDRTWRLLDARAFSKMKRGSYLINTARGGLLDQRALLCALDSGRLAGAALDVTDPEPLPEADPLRTHPDVILTPHVAFHSAESVTRLQSLAVDEGRRALRGQDLRCPVTLPGAAPG